MNSGFRARLYHFVQSDIHHREPSPGIILVGGLSNSSLSGAGLSLWSRA